MKLFFSVIALCVSLSGLASTGETKTFNYDGSQDSVDLLLKGEKTHTEYKVEDVPSTCYRQEIVGYSTICTGGGYYGPGRGYPGPGYPRPYPGPYYPSPYPQTCYQQPIYRQIPYSCIRTVRTPFEVKDFDVDTKVTLTIVKASSEASLEKFTVSLNGDQITLMMNGSKKFIGVVKNETIEPVMAGSVKIINATYNVELVEASVVVTAIKLTKISIKDGLLSVKAGPAAGRGDISVALNVVKKKALASDDTLLDRTLKQGEFTVRSEDAITSSVEVNMPALGLPLKNGKFSITARLFFAGKVLNRIELPALESTRTLIYKN